MPLRRAAGRRLRLAVGACQDGLAEQAGCQHSGVETVTGPVTAPVAPLPYELGREAETEVTQRARGCSLPPVKQPAPLSMHKHSPLWCGRGGLRCITSAADGRRGQAGPVLPRCSGAPAVLHRSSAVGGGRPRTALAREQ